MRRREFVAGLCAAAWPAVAWAQQAVPVVGYLHSGSPNATTNISLAAFHAIGLELHILRASTDIELDSIFASLAQFRINALVIGADAILGSRSAKLAALAVRYAVPTVSPYRAFAMAGGLMGYGSSTTDSYRLAGVYTGRILKGEKPSDLPVQQATKVELVINLKTAKALGITIPLPLLGRADEVIE